MRQSWGDFLKGAGARSHGVQVYGDAADLAESVASYLAAGLERDQPGILVATPEHLSLFAERLDARGWGFARAESAGLLVVADAEETLASILGPDGLESGRFEHVVGGLLDRVQHGPEDRPARVFGEVVDLLCRRDQAAAADELERLWNALAQRRRFSLLCGYRLDVFDSQAQIETLPHICREHSHVLPARNYPRFARAVDSALREVLGPNQAATVYVLVSREPGHDQVPLAQAILMWVSENMPKQSSQILAAARTHYARPAA
ncbi:MAG TPA: MEDS domain-containing protein [Gaiellaceae bacterium]|nr:MEDS domain-containing protein [Gaiellaceae bacterium]